MAWGLPDRAVVGDVMTVVWGTAVADSLAAASLHAHGGAAGAGDDQLVGSDSIDMDDIAAPDAPGAGKTIISAQSGKLNQRAGAAGTSEELSVTTHTH